jgi:hypothetical protein
MNGPSPDKQREALKVLIADDELRLRLAKRILPSTSGDLAEILQQHLEMWEGERLQRLRGEDDHSKVRFIQGELSLIRRTLEHLDHPVLMERIDELEKSISARTATLDKIRPLTPRLPDLPE